MAMKPGEIPMETMLRYDRVVQRLAMLEQQTPEDGGLVTIVSGLFRCTTDSEPSGNGQYTSI